jgi:hypothetical protein
MGRKNGCTSNNKQCPHCDKEFTRSTGLTTHLPICKVIKTNKQQIKNDLQLQITAINGKLSNLKKQLKYSLKNDHILHQQLNDEMDGLKMEKNELIDEMV